MKDSKYLKRIKFIIRLLLNMFLFNGQLLVSVVLSQIVNLKFENNLLFDCKLI
jgi:hypothetical protein